MTSGIDLVKPKAAGFVNKYDLVDHQVTAQGNNIGYFGITVISVRCYVPCEIVKTMDFLTVSH